MKEIGEIDIFAMKNPLLSLPLELWLSLPLVQGWGEGLNFY
jgi:hypothetical protein